ncbi:MAG TPA: polysaccharide biosynthesis C-terminal domain-containing protein [Actinomycetota bacterium]|nr:polysaccharide biosynthesis C-terminal domain-containing protein [Actinomycetota bacterium]
MTESQEQQDTVPAGAPDPHPDPELDAIAEIEVEGLPVSTDSAPGRSGGPSARFRSALDAVLPRGKFGDQRDILGGAGQNVIGLAAGVMTAFATQVIMTRGLGPALFGVVTLTTQFAFIASTATRFGMDVANVRLVAILLGQGEPGRTRPLVRKSAVIAAVTSVIVGLAVILLSGQLSDWFVSDRLHQQGVVAFVAAGVAIPFAALTWVYLGGTRGLKIMRHTLYIFWIGQPLGWIAFAVVGWFVAKTAGVTAFAYTASWGVACLFAWWAWERETRGFHARTEGGGIPEERTGALMKFGALRAPATLFAQLLFWIDTFVLAAYRSSAEVGVYGATVRTGQSLLLFLTSLSLVFSPFVADLHYRGEHEKLDALYKNVTRWGLATTLPVLLALAILPGTIMRVYGPRFVIGAPALEILIIGLIVPVIVGTVGFILIMVGRTGWDLLVYVASFFTAVGIAVVFAPRYGMRGAAVAEAVTLTLSAFARLMLVKKFVNIWPFDRWFLRLIPPALAGGAMMWLVHQVLEGPKWLIDLGGSVGAGTIVYGVVLVVWGLKPAERATVMALVRKLLGRTPTGSVPAA